MNLLFEPLQWGFMGKALLASGVLGLVCGVLGCHVVLRGLSFVGDALSHSLLPGVALASLWGFNLQLGAALAAVSTVGIISRLSHHRHLSQDTVIGITFSAALALGVALVSRTPGYTRDLAHLLFGNVLAVSWQDFRMVTLAGLATLASLLLLHRELTIVGFDPVHARKMGLPVEALHLLLLLLIALTVVSGVQTVGVLLITAQLITPAATARLLCRRLNSMLVMAGLLGAGASTAGLYLSYFTNTPPSAAIVLINSAIFFLSWGCQSQCRGGVGQCPPSISTWR